MDADAGVDIVTPHKDRYGSWAVIPSGKRVEVTLTTQGNTQIMVTHDSEEEARAQILDTLKALK
jgi:hypothetical protein